MSLPFTFVFFNFIQRNELTMSDPLDDDLPPYFDESIYEPEDKPEEMFICSVCGKLLEPSYEQWICNFCMSYDSHAYKYARNQNQENESDYD